MPPGSKKIHGIKSCLAAAKAKMEKTSDLILNDARGQHGHRREPRAASAHAVAMSSEPMALP